MEPLNWPSGTYKTIYVDPPWPERGGGKIKRGADRHYSLMSVKEIVTLPVDELADPEGCHLYLWATNNYLPAAFECIKAWGFKYIGMAKIIKFIFDGCDNNFAVEAPADITLEQLLKQVDRMNIYG